MDQFTSDPFATPTALPERAPAMPQGTPIPLRPGYQVPAGYAQPLQPQPAQQQDVGFMPASQQFNVQSAPQAPMQTSVTETVQPGVQISPEMRKQIEESYTAREKALNMQAEAQSKAIALQAEYDGKMLEERNRIADEQRVATERAQMNVQQAKVDYDRFKKDAEGSVIDPNRFFDGKTENKVLAALVAGAGAWSAAMTGGKNYALEIINDAIEQDITEQKIAMSRKDARAAEARRQYENAQDKFGNADAAFRVMRLEAVEAMGKKLLSSASNDVVKANLAASLAQLTDEKLKRNLELVQQSAGKRTVSTQVVADGTGRKMENPSDTPFGRAFNVNGATKVNDAYAAQMKLNDAMNRAKDVVKKYGNVEVMNAEGKAALRAVKLDVVQALQAFSNSGVLNPGEYVRFSQEVPIDNFEAIYTRPQFVLSYFDQIAKKSKYDLDSLVKANVRGGTTPAYAPKTYKGN
jgi:hypothetical protein